MNRNASLPKRCANFPHPVCGFFDTSNTADPMDSWGSSRQVVNANVEVDDKLVARQFPPFIGLSYQREKTGVDDRDLCDGVRSAIRCARATSGLPVIADKTGRLRRGRLPARPPDWSTSVRRTIFNRAPSFAGDCNTCSSPAPSWSVVRWWLIVGSSCQTAGSFAAEKILNPAAISSRAEVPRFSGLQSSRGLSWRRFQMRRRGWPMRRIPIL